MSKNKVCLIFILLCFLSAATRAECVNHKDFIRDAKKLDFMMYANINLLERLNEEELTADERTNAIFFKNHEQSIKGKLVELVAIASEYELSGVNSGKKAAARNLLDKNSKEVIKHIEGLLIHFYNMGRISARPMFLTPLQLTLDNVLEARVLVINFCPSSFPLE